MYLLPKSLSKVLKKYKKNLMIGFLSIMTGTVTVSFFLPVDSADILENAFRQAKNFQHVVNLGNNPNAVGNEVFRGSTNINLTSDLSVIGSRDPLYIRLIKFLLRISIILSVTFIIYNGIQYILARDDDKATSTARDSVVNILRGLVIALGSLSMVYLVQSITITTINNDPSADAFLGNQSIQDNK